MRATFLENDGLADLRQKCRCIRRGAGVEAGLSPSFLVESTEPTIATCGLTWR